ncbi:DNA polymerase I [Inmirania thermothiophila]|uniref:DNA polymerase I n=1 Tax=Inmirania thermothiophila TaxID=1750597 RepID=A0A3N1Y6A0_9GAMM|nr:DNA polymerase I [Inmirania thermothiophila]ROR34280.1 DNA polymerase I [Inmirania thermothiophila]
MREKPTPLVLVDASSYLYRAFHALPPLANSRGEPTGAIHGVLTMLRRLLADLRPERIGVVFDAPGRTFRDDLFERYKAQRPPMPEALAAQVEPLLEAIEAMGLPLLRVPGVEADDVIGTLARRAAARGLDTVISTGDKDMAQLVGPHVTLVNTMTGTVLDAAGVEARFGVPPERIVDLLALMGDASDNIPGVPRWGPKTAARWLRHYGSLDALLAHADEIPGKAGESLRAHLDQLALSRELATIRRDLDLETDLDDLRPRPPDRGRLRAIYQRLELARLLRALEEEEGAPGDGAERAEAAPRAEVEVILDEAALARWLERLAAAELVAIDTETTSLDPLDARIVGLSFAVDETRAAYLPLGHDYADAPPQLPREAVLARLRPILEDPARPKLAHNLKYDLAVLWGAGIEPAGLAHDTMLQSYVLDAAAARHDLDTLALRHLGRRTTRYEEVAGKGAREIPFGQVRIEDAAPYAAEDAEVALALHRVLWPRLAAEPDLRRVYEEIEMPLVPVLARMERHGVLVDAALLRAQGEELAARLAELEREAHRLAGRPFNLNSPKQLQEILFGELGLPVRRRTPKGQPSTAEEALQELALDYPLPRVILEHRALAKLKGTYIDRLPERIHPRTGRVHTSYHQAGTATGRLASADPNLQNIPVRTPEGRRIRQAFIAPPGHLLLSADYSQIELRIMAHLSGDEGLLRAFAEGRDIHQATAAEVFGVAPEAVTPAQRRAAKAINFGLIYGMSAFGLARQLGIPREEAQAYIDRYFARYRGVAAFMERTREQARRDGYVTTLFGRRLHLPELRAASAARRAAAERAAINAPMQGTAADLIKRAMIAIDRWLRETGSGAHLILQVHDELVLEVPEAEVERVREAVVRCMREAGRLRVPLVVETGVGRNWDEAH